ncbi:hypothetical protein [Flavobacterium sp.]|uniref:hypothetical protein n=1 Tax=Flavobacterium sp. TaxID=239 RepID=UPI0039E4C115
MKKMIFMAAASLLVASCGSAFYTKEFTHQTSGVDFSNGKWLLGDIHMDGNYKAEFTKMVMADFAQHLQGRIVNSLDQKSLLLSQTVPLNPSKSVMADLKKGTNYDYYINIKCADQRVHSDKDLIESTYYIKNMTYGVVQLEIYDLNQGVIVYSQRVHGRYDEHAGVSSKPSRQLIFGCYGRIINDIDKKS